MRPSDPRPDPRLASMIVVERRMAELRHEVEMARLAAVRRQPVHGRVARSGVRSPTRLLRALAGSALLGRRRIAADVDGVGRRGV